MKQRRLGGSGIVVSEICLGTMTFGTQADKAESFRIMDHAVEAGVDFFDTAEVYPVPPTAELAGLTEEWVGNWMKDKPRESLIIATKIAGAAHGWFNPPIRHGKAALDRVHLRRALEGSLRRLGTDYIDLYQVHWPDHGMRAEDTLEELDNFVRQGKVRAIGISNEDSYGLMKGLWTSDVHGYARYDTIQNNFSLNNRRAEDELAEVCRRENVSLLPYSPLAGGVLSGKYNAGTPEGARFTAYLKAGPRQAKMAERFVNEHSLESTRRFIEIGEKAGLDPVTLATAWSKQHDFVASTIIGASKAEQLTPILAAAGLQLSEEVLAEIDQVSEEIRYPMG
ncbi:aldo/keto reductase [Roseibacillus ishigakijimensis]|uniref:Aldo/keto reductase n=1 Tax=Roseibacillus ishigakijimensis TaxID=454146 RepID=A0A934RQF3_9BACT|nr:aldo/keto reductase [Roseibacillus ishigakijimensis]MBK1833563.1 aldo/keto reductase [Roseibacillus ishigakijimensis]